VFNDALCGSDSRKVVKSWKICLSFIWILRELTPRCSYNFII